MKTGSAVLCLDVGGSSVKSGVVLASGQVVIGPQRARIVSRGTAEQVVNGLATALLSLQRQAADLAVRGIGVAMPGPFDYQAGVSSMRGLGKFDAIRGLPLAEAVVERAPTIAGLPWRWLNDAQAFALGELRFGVAAGVSRVLFLTLGTGCGSAFAVDGELVVSGRGVPAGGFVYALEHRGRTVDQLLSARGLVRLWREEVASRPASVGSSSAGKGRYSARHVGRLAEEGDDAALIAFQRFGALLATALAEVYEAFEPELVVLGGQVSRSLAHFGPAAAAAGAPRLSPASAPELAALRGAAVNVFKGGTVA